MPLGKRSAGGATAEEGSSAPSNGTAPRGERRRKVSKTFFLAPDIQNTFAHTRRRHHTGYGRDARYILIFFLFFSGTPQLRCSKTLLNPSKPDFDREKKTKKVQPDEKKNSPWPI